MNYVNTTHLYALTNAIVMIIEGSRPEWTNPQIEDGKLPEMPKNHTYRKGKGVK